MLSQFCIKRPIFATVLSLLILLAGFLSYRNLGLSQYPNITPPTVTISTTYSGANAETLARTVASPIEDQLSGIEGLLYYTTSIRSNGDVRVQCIFDVGTDVNSAMLEINNRMRSIESRMPDSVKQNGISIRKRSEDALLRLVFTSPQNDLTRTDLADFVNLNVLDYVKRLPGISDASIGGNVASAMRIWMDPQRMAALNVTPTDIDNAVSAQNKQRGAGRVGTAPTTDTQQLFYTTTAPGQLLTTEQFGNIIVRNDPKTGAAIHLRDVARLEDGNRSYDFRSQNNGKEAVSVTVYLQTGANSLAAATAVKDEMQQLSATFPSNIAYQITDDTTLFVTESLKEVFKTLLEAALLVVAVVFVFLQNWRATLVPMLAVPVSLIGTMAGLYVLNFSLNTLTLFAMTLAIGIVVDDAIVVLENVERLMSEEGLTPFAAAQKAMKEVSGALVAIVLVLASCFIPVAFLGGMAGELYRQFAITVALSVILSGFVALTLTPALCSILLKPNTNKKKARFFVWFDQAFDALSLIYIRAIKLALHWRSISALILVAVVAGCWYMLNTVPTSFIPREDQGLIRMSVSLPEGSSFVRTEAEVKRINQIIEKIPGIDASLVMLGIDSQSGDQRQDAATYILKLKPWDQRTQTAQQIASELQGFMNDNTKSVAVVTLPPAIRGLGSSAGFSGYLEAHGESDPLVLQGVLQDFINTLKSHPELTSLRGISNAATPMLKVAVDQEKAQRLGVNVDTIYSDLSTYFSGTYINDYTRNGKLYRVIMQADAPYRMAPEDLGRCWVRSSTTGEMVPMASMVTVTRTSGADSIARMNGYLAAQFSGAAAPGVSSGTAISLVEQIAQQTLPPGYSIAWTGQALQEKLVGSSSTNAMVFGLLMVFLLLAALYERWSLPIAVVLALPYALLAALVGVTLRGTSNDIYFQIGLLVLIGLTAKNAILIVEFALLKLEEGFGPFDAALEGAKLRFRPILMTSLAFVLGVLPLVMATGAGANARISMGTGVFSGMLGATFISTIFVPVFFTWLVRTKKTHTIPKEKILVQNSGDK